VALAVGASTVRNTLKVQVSTLKMTDTSAVLGNHHTSIKALNHTQKQTCRTSSFAICCETNPGLFAAFGVLTSAYGVTVKNNEER